MSEMSNAEKQAEAQAWRDWEKAWGNTESGAHVHGWQAGVAWARAQQQDCLITDTDDAIAAERARAEAAEGREAQTREHLRELVNALLPAEGRENPYWVGAVLVRARDYLAGAPEGEQ